MSEKLTSFWIAPEIKSIYFLTLKKFRQRIYELSLETYSGSLHAPNMLSYNLVGSAQNFGTVIYILTVT